jgi:hypothetical protein
MSSFDFTKPPVKEEGSSVTDSYKYKAANRYPPYPAPLTIQEGDRTIVVSEMLQQLEYILQRTVPDYDELVKQFNAIKDIERCSNDIR